MIGFEPRFCSLSRMGTLPKRPLSELRPIADDLMARLRPACERIEIAGSIRRERPQVGDIELVAIPKFETRRNAAQGTLFGPQRPSRADQVNLLWEAVDALGVACSKRGPVYRQFTWRGVRVDIYTCERGNWGWILFHRTGPGYLRAKIGSMLVARGFAAVDGWIWDARGLSIDRVETPEEDDVFRLLGIPPLPPDRRDQLKGPEGPA
jgi:DNA polymerase/3'-5' exonuclease PolX